MSLSPSPVQMPPDGTTYQAPHEQTAARGSTAAVRAWRVVGITLVALLVAAGTTAVVTQFFVRQTHTTQAYPQVSVLRASTDSGEITVSPAGAGEPTRVVVVRRSAFRTTEASQELVGRELVVSGTCHGAWPFSDPCAVDIEVTIAPGARVLQLSSTTGRIQVSGVAGDVTAQTSTGSVQLADVTSQQVTARADTGGVDLRFATAPQRVVATAGTGAVAVTVPADGTTYRVDARTDVGAPEVTVPTDPASEHRIQARASVGAVVVRTGG